MALGTPMEKIASFMPGFPPEKVAAFYRERLKALGWESNSDMNLGGSMMITASSKTTGSVNAVVGAKEGGGTTLSLTYGDKES